MKILVAEDEVDYRSALCEALELSGHSVKSVSNGVDAFRCLEIEQFDLIISDINMPNRTGSQLHEMIRRVEHLKDIPFIYITGLAVLRLTTPVDSNGLDFVMGKTAFDRLLKLVEDISLHRSNLREDRIALGWF